MSAHYWIFLAAVLGGLAVVAGAIGAHLLPGEASLDGALRSYTTAQHNHALHALALLGVGLLMLQSEAYRTSFSSWAMQAAATAFTIGIVLFSGGIYAHVAGGFASTTKFVPVGGMFFIAGWAALAIGALGLRG
ncbi:MAG: DUF423 domain-containing protein [Rhodomicrobium sp.]